MSPDYRVNIWNFRDETVSVRLLTLVAWKYHMKVHLAGMKCSGRFIFAIVKDYLSAPMSYSNQDMYQHICDSLDSINEQLGV